MVCEACTFPPQADAGCSAHSPQQKWRLFLKQSALCDVFLWLIHSCCVIPQNHSLLMELLTDEGVGTMLVGSSRGRPSPATAPMAEPIAV